MPLAASAASSAALDTGGGRLAYYSVFGVAARRGYHLSHDERVGMKWKGVLGCFFSQRSFFLCVLSLLRMT